MDYETKLRKLEGLHTVDTIMATLAIKKQSALNLISQMKKRQNLTVWSGGKKKMYDITMRKQHRRMPGMFDIINTYSPMKLAPWYDHQVHGPYGPEEALIDAILTGSFRVILASLRLFNHIKDWNTVNRLAKEKGCWQKVGALYDVARLHFKVRKMKGRYTLDANMKWQQLSQLKKKNYPEIANKWHVYIPFNEKDIMEIRHDWAR